VRERVNALDDAKLKASIEKHSLEADISLSRYVRNRRIELGKNVTQRKLIYLDTRYWIILRDVLLRRRTDDSGVRLLNSLRLKARQEKVICPISASVFIKLLKQQDLQTRRKTAELIDELSLGITLADEEERIKTELAHLIYSNFGRDSIYPLKWLIWSKLSYVFGVVHLTNIEIGSEKLIFQKVVFDHMWDCTLAEMIDTLGDEQPPESDFKALASMLNEGNADNAGEIQNFRQAYTIEIEGCLSLFIPDALKILEDMFERRTGNVIKDFSIEREEHEFQLLSFFCKLSGKNKLPTLLPTLHIIALCHASLRWDKNRKFKRNDFYDFYHAAAAVAYCDAFLTENPLKTLLEQNHLQIEQDFDCRIISSIEEAVGFIEKEL